MKEPVITHYVEWDAERFFRDTHARALCGKMVNLDREESLTPTCPTCAQHLVEFDKMVEVIGA